MRSFNVTLTEVAAALRQQNFELPAGRIPQGSQELTVRTMGKITDPQAFKTIPVAERAGYVVRLGDIAEVVDAQEELRSCVLPEREVGGHACRAETVRPEHRDGRGGSQGEARPPGGHAAAGRLHGHPPRSVGVHPRRHLIARGAPRGRQHPGEHRGVLLPRQLPHDADCRGRHPDVDRVDLRADRCDGLHAQSADDARADADGRRRDRRRDHRAREHLPVSSKRRAWRRSTPPSRARARSASR